MKAPREHSRSVWMTIEVAPDSRPLASDGETDVVVIGSGIAGLSIAYELTSRGHAAVVVDRGEIARGNDLADDSPSHADLRRDCPCHGSHFAPDGTVLNAPAINPHGRNQR